ncbi:MAG: hypothetical protein U9R16_01925 [Campylobacterota bacterium]|nr:hypothetical protein [Campylobacterota bacterium]
MKDNELDNLEEFIPLLAKGAMQKAYLDTLASGDSVLEVLDDTIYEVFADGTKTKIKDIAPSLNVEINSKILLG